MHVLKLLRIALPAFFVGVGFGQRASAAPITAYYDQASWDAAVTGLTIGTYSAGGTKTVITTTISTEQAPDCPQQSGICVISTSSTTTQIFGLSSIHAIMSYPNTCADCTAITEIDITFDSPILAFSAMSSGFNEIPGLVVNGFALPATPPQIPQFIGLVGPISDLKFTAPGYTDNPATLDLSGIVVATVPEPSTWSFLAVAMLFFFATRWQRNRQPSA